jgi:hypothetical protein
LCRSQRGAGYHPRHLELGALGAVHVLADPLGDPPCIADAVGQPDAAEPAALTNSPGVEASRRS